MKSAPPIAPPGWPDFAFSTIAADRILMLSAALFISCLLFIPNMYCLGKLFFSFYGFLCAFIY